MWWTSTDTQLINLHLFCCRGPHKVEEACEMYCRAANMFKMAKNWSGALCDTVQPLYLQYRTFETKFCSSLQLICCQVKIWIIYFLLLLLASCWRSILQGGTSPHAAAEQTRLRHQLHRCGKCLQEIRPEWWVREFGLEKSSHMLHDAPHPSEAPWLCPLAHDCFFTRWFVWPILALLINQKKHLALCLQRCFLGESVRKQNNDFIAGCHF